MSDSEDEATISIDTLCCPITSLLMFDPVFIDDGYTYERQGIENWFKEHNTSPLTRQPVTQTMVPNIIVKKIIDDLLKKNPDLKDEQYVPIIDYTSCKSEIIDHIVNKKYYKLKEYNEYKLLDANIIVPGYPHKFAHFIILMTIIPDISVVKHIIDNSVDLEDTTNNGWKPIHYICRYFVPEIIKHTLDKEIDLESQTNDGWKPIHIACLHSTPDVIEYLAYKGVDLESKDMQNRQPVSMISVQYYNDHENLDKLVTLILELIKYRNTENWLNAYGAQVYLEQPVDEEDVESSASLELSEDIGLEDVGLIEDSNELLIEQF